MSKQKPKSPTEPGKSDELDKSAEPRKNVGLEKCPICGAQTAHKSRPFCSARCANVDLSRWLTGRYAIPVVEDEDEDGGLPYTEDF